MQPNAHYVDQNITDAELVISGQDDPGFVGEAIIELVDKIAQWGIDRNITAEGGATTLSQMKKLREECNEIEEGILANNRTEIADGIGDSMVVLIQQCRLSGISVEEALTQAWNSIKDRKGKMVDGVFVKEA